MALFDLFGVKKDLKDGADAPEESSSSPNAGKAGTSKRALGVFVLADIAVIALCAVFLSARVHKHLTAAESPAPAPRAAKKPPPKESAAKKPAASEPAPAKPAAEPESKPKPKPAPKAKAEPEKPAVSEKKKRKTRPVPFTYVDPSAREVALLGAFLVRQNGRKSMFKDSKGTWQTTVYLNTGVNYRYKFEVVDKNGRKSITPTESVDVVSP